VLTARELVTYPTLRGSTLYDALMGLRPEYMTPHFSYRAGVLIGTPVVIMDGTARGGLESLRSIQSSIVSEVRFLRSSDVVVLYGSSFHTGAIVVTSISR
jgi:hypothetical protein